MNRQKILLVDDEPHNLQLLRQILKDDYTLIFAKNGKDALKNAVNSRPDLILLDVMMPDMDGYAVCRQLKQDRRIDDIPVIFVTALADEHDEAHGFQVGGIDYITKPIRPLTLKHRVKVHLMVNDQYRASQELVAEKSKELRNTRLRGLMMLGKAAEYKDNETGMHVQRMSRFSEVIARAYGWHNDACELILHAAPMHDIGKIGIPDNILQKPGKLDKDEWQIMKRHPQIGAGIIGEFQDNSELFTMAEVIAKTHHEKWDGSGYPRQLSGENIPVEGRIVAVADVFDALVSRRPYKAPWPTEKALALLKDERGSHFDPTFVDLFFDNLPEILKIKARWDDDAVGGLDKK